MTFCEAEDTLPHGFHDAKLFAMHFDFRDGTGFVELGVMVQQMHEETRHERLRLVLRGLVAVSISHQDEVPADLTDSLDVSSFPTTEKELPGFSALPPEVQMLYGSLYVHEPWNNYIHIAAREASIEWLTILN